MIVDSAARHLGDLLDRLNLPWTVTGGHAANVYRDEIRHTSDVDIRPLAKTAQPQCLGSPERAWESCGSIWHQLASSTCAAAKSSMASKMAERRSIFLCCSK